MQYVRVTNNSPNLIVGRFDGEDYPFPVGEPVDVPAHIANHVFGFGSPKGSVDKLRALMNLGWLRTSDEEPDAMRKLGDIRFDAIEMVGRAVEEEPDSASSADMVPRLNAPGDRIGDVSPNADADGTTGAGSHSPASDSQDVV